MKKGTIDTRDTLSAIIIKDEVIIPDDFKFIDFGTKDNDSFHSPNNIGEIEDTTINSGEANEESFIEICDSDAKKTTSNKRRIDHAYNDEKVSVYSQLCLKCGITTSELMNQTELCKATKSFTCSACSFKCCSRMNLERHMQNDHKMSINAITSDSNVKEMSKSMNNSSNKRSPRRFSKINRKKDIIEVYCEKCKNTSRPSTNDMRETCELCNSYAIFQCKICKNRYKYRGSMYSHLKYGCLNVESQYKCSQCDYKAKQKIHLQSHMKSKHDAKKCTRCGETFKNVNSLRKHQLTKCVNETILNCNCCSYKTIFKWRLEKHICASKLYFECNHCSYRTDVKKSLERHIKGQHSEIFLFGD